MLKGSKHLRIAGFLEILIGVVMLLVTWFLVGSGDFSKVVNEGLADNALMSITVLYGFHIFEIFTGIIGVLRANKKSYFALILGIILFVINLWEFFTYADMGILQIVMHALTLVVPYYYIHNAFRNIKG